MWIPEPGEYSGTSFSKIANNIVFCIIDMGSHQIDIDCAFKYEFIVCNYLDRPYLEAIQIFIVTIPDHASILVSEISKTMKTFYATDLKLSDPSEHNYQEIYIKNIKYCPMFLKYINDQTDKICKLAVKTYYHSAKYIREPTDRLCEMLIESRPYVIEYFEQTDKRIIQAMRCHIYSVNSIRDRSERTIRLILSIRPLAAYFLKPHMTPELYKYAINLDPQISQYLAI